MKIAKLMAYRPLEDVVTMARMSSSILDFEEANNTWSRSFMKFANFESSM